MDVHIEELTADVGIADDEALLTPALMRRLVAAVMAEITRQDRARDIAQANTRLGRAAAPRPDRMR